MIKQLLLMFAVMTTGWTGEKEILDSSQKYKVGLCVVATGKYDRFVAPLIHSAEKYFCQNHEVTYFVFGSGNFPKGERIINIPQEPLGWPYDSLKRFSIYLEHFESFKGMDYLFACDADMLFVAPVGDEILGNLVATLSPCCVGKRGTFETNKISVAFVNKEQRRKKPYFAGAFFGGRKEEFRQLLIQVDQQINSDLSHGYIAVWHDESHLNRYFIDHPPHTVLSPAYCYPESREIPYEKKLVALDKPRCSELRTAK